MNPYISIRSTVSPTGSHELTVIVAVPYFIAPLPYTISFHSPPFGVIFIFCIMRSPVNRIVAVASSVRSMFIVTDPSHSGLVSHGLSEYSGLPPSVAPLPLCHFLRAA